MDKDDDDHITEYDVASVWTAGTWYHIVLTWNFNTNSMILYTAGTQRDNTPDVALSSDSIDDVGNNLYFGQNLNNLYQFNGTIAGRILNRPLTSTEVTALYNSGNGSTDTFTVTPDTVWMGAFSD